MRRADVYTIIAIIVVIAAGGFYLSDGFSGMLIGPAQQNLTVGEDINLIVNVPAYNKEKIELLLPLQFTNGDNKWVRIPDIDITVVDPNGVRYPYNPDLSTTPFSNLGPSERKPLNLVYYIPPSAERAILLVNARGVESQLVIFRDGNVTIRDPVTIEL